ncbi:MAG: hypothetical protein ACOC3X_02480 [Nanoarchaeota archaeon]
MLQILKFGSACIFDKYGKLNTKYVEKKATEIENLTNEGIDSVLVVSGAIPYGMLLENEKRKKEELSTVELQGYASVGQPKLMNLYDDLFSLNTGQLLITIDDLIDSNKVKNLIDENRNKKRISLINWNDSTDFDQLRLDNDVPAGVITNYCNASRLIMFLGGDYDCFIRNNEKVFDLSSIKEINKQYNFCIDKSNLGNGGFESKLNCAKIILDSKAKMYISHVKYDLDDILQKKVPVTYVA